MCDAGCGILVRTREHKANKIEGNPAPPGQSRRAVRAGPGGVQLLYNPDRLRAPLKRTGERGRGEFEEIGWDEAYKNARRKIREIKARPGRAGSVVLYDRRPARRIRLAAEHLLSAYGSSAISRASIASEYWASSSYEASYNTTAIPLFDIANASYLLSFGARFLETWHSPVMYSLAYGEFRRVAGESARPVRSRRAANVAHRRQRRRVAPRRRGQRRRARARNRPGDNPRRVDKERSRAGAPPAPRRAYAPEQVAAHT